VTAPEARALAAVSLAFGPLGWLAAAYWTRVAERLEAAAPPPANFQGPKWPLQPPHPLVRR